MNHPHSHSVFRVHGGADSFGPVRFDFSSNANSTGPNPFVVDLIKQTDLIQYPDPNYTELRQSLANMHAVDVNRILIAGSASEFIFRITSFVSQRSSSFNQDDVDNKNASVWLPAHAYGDYASASLAWGLNQTQLLHEAALVWLCEPSSPLGQPVTHLDNLVDSLSTHQIAVLDCAYEPLRLSGKLQLNQHQLNRLWQMWTPNKALGLTGVRGAYVIAPLNAEHVVQGLIAIAPSWLVGAEGVTMLKAWTRPEVQNWVGDSLMTLRRWKTEQIALCNEIGFKTEESVSNFFCVSHPSHKPAEYLSVVRRFDVKLRDAASFGLPDHVRMAVLSPQAQQQFREAMMHVVRSV